MDFLDNLGIIAVPAIAAICFLIAEGVKALKIDNKWIPVICGACGAVLGVVAMYTMPDFPGTDILGSIAIGIVSGFGATGAHQVYKQLTKE